jgi:ribosomal protein L29
MKKLMSEFQNKSVKELEKEVMTLRAEISKLKVERVVNPPKDTNLEGKKIQRVARIATVINEKKHE